MNEAIRRVGISVTVLLLVLIAQLTYLQVVDAKKLADDPRNSRTFLRDFTRPRGEIVSADGVVLAKSVPSNDEFEFQRMYPTNELFSQVVGYQSITVGSTGLEQTYNGVLTGRDTRGLNLGDLGELLLGKQRVFSLDVSMRADAQQVAKDALGDLRGSVVVLEPRTGHVVAMYSNPSFASQPLADHKPKAVQAYYDLLRDAPGNPALPRAYRERYPPGSTFKIVTTAAGLDTGTVTPESTFPSVSSIDLPQSDRTVQNFGGDTCGGDLETVFVRSCNTAFGLIGLALGEQFPPRMQGFGIYDNPPLDVAPGAVVSTGPPPGSFQQNQPLFALAGFGQGDVATTPLQMALVGAAVANGGVVMEPRVGAGVKDQDGKTVRTIAGREWHRAMPPETAALISSYMVQVVERGTGRAAQIPGVTVAGKTGTAQTCEGCKPHAWFVAFAPVEAPQYAVAVIIENGGNVGSEATGGRIAAPIAAQMLRFLLGR